jgi:hypothetical protein
LNHKLVLLGYERLAAPLTYRVIAVLGRPTQGHSLLFTELSTGFPVQFRQKKILAEATASYSIMYQSLDHQLSI